MINKFKVNSKLTLKINKGKVSSTGYSCHIQMYCRPLWWNCMYKYIHAGHLYVGWPSVSMLQLQGSFGSLDEEGRREVLWLSLQYKQTGFSQNDKLSYQAPSFCALHSETVVALPLLSVFAETAEKVFVMYLLLTAHRLLVGRWWMHLLLTA